MSEMTNRDEAVEVLVHIGSELKLLWWQLEAWLELFDIEQEKRAALLQATAPGFFAITQVALAESILLRISRLMDRPKTYGEENSSLQRLLCALPDDPACSLRKAVQSVISDWQQRNKETKEEEGPYAPLKIARNKWLAHNGREQRSERSPDALWMPLTHADFAVAQQLAGQLWSVYRQASRDLNNKDVVEPRHERLDNRSGVILKHLSASRYLERLIEKDDALAQRVVDFEQQCMGEDRIRNVFTAEGRGHD